MFHTDKRVVLSAYRTNSYFQNASLFKVLSSSIVLTLKDKTIDSLGKSKLKAEYCYDIFYSAA